MTSGGPPDPVAASRFARVAEVFAAARRLPPDQRPSYLSDACGEDRPLLAEVEALLVEDSRTGGPLDASAGLRFAAEAALLDAVEAADADAPLPQRVGPYRVLRCVGRGGMGIVYEALDEALERRVAVKVLTHDLTSPEAHRRFEVEARALARLSHPGIARILASGSAAGSGSSRPWIAMELVEGRPLLDHLRERGLDTRGRVEILQRVAEAVAHAHLHGVVHRDLKPGNVLVESSGQPKVLDFGVARIVDPGAERSGPATLGGRILGTVAYMSPEQALGDPDAVDARSDVYSLGVLAYQALSGSLPVEVDRLSLSAAVRAVVETEPTPLGRRDPALAGDLSAVVGKAIEKRKERRYQGAAAFADDLRRWLADEEVVARSPTPLERAARFVRRHRILVASALMVTTALVVGVLLALASAREEQAARRTAEDAAYRAEIAAAAAALRADDPAGARRHLELAQEDRRGWEWLYLAARLDAFVARVPLDAPADRPVAVSPDLDAVAYAGTDGRLVIVDARTGRPRAGSGAPFGPEGHAAWSSGALATGGADGLVRLLDPTTGETRGAPLDVGAPVQALALSDDGARLAVTTHGSDDAAADHRLAILDAAQGVLVAERFGAGWSGAALGFDADGGRVALGSWDHRVRVAASGSPEPGLSLSGHANWALALDFAGSDRLVTGAADRKVGLWNFETGALVHLWSGHVASVESVAVEPRGRRAASAARDGTVRLWDLVRGVPDGVHEAGRPGEPIRVRWSADGAWLLAANPREILAFPGDVPGPPEALAGHRGVAEGNQFPYVYDIDWSPDGTRLLSAGWDGTLRVWEADTGRLLATHECGALARSGAWSPDGTTVAAACGDGTLLLFRADGGPPIATRSGLPARANGAVAFSPDGRTLLVTGDAGRVELLETERLEPVGALEGHGALVTCVGFSPDGVLCASGDENGVCLVRDGATGRVRLRVGEGLGAVQGLAFSPDGSRLALAGRDRRLVVVDAATGTTLWTSPAFPDALYSVAWSRDGSRVLSGGGDGTVRVHDASTGHELLVLSGHEAYVMSIALSPDGLTLASASGDNTVRLWSCLPLSARRLRARLPPP